MGEKIQISGPIGRFNYKGRGQVAIKDKRTMKLIEKKYRHICMVAGGSGLTPCSQIIQAIDKDPKDKTKTTLLFANKKEEDILLRETLEAYKMRGSTDLYYTLDNPPENWSGFKGFISKDMLSKCFPKAASDVLFVACGPPPMINLEMG